MEFNKFFYIINKTYNRDTCYTSLQNEWDEKNPTLGHCAIVALKFLDIYGGEIIRVNIKNSNITHYYNCLNGNIFDITKDQFKNNEVYENEIIKTKDEIMSNEDFAARYKIFSDRFDNYLKQLDEIDSQVLNCNKCLNKVEKFNHNTTISYGKNSSILVIGEAPANNGWRKSGKCWYKEDGNITGSGKIMTKLLNLINYNLDDITFVEAVKCFPPKRSDLNYCKSNCYPYLLKQIKILSPKLILTLGDVATKSVLKDINYKNFAEVVGNEYKIKIEEVEYIVIPVYHPSPISPLSYKGNEVIFLKLLMKWEK